MVKILFINFHKNYNEKNIKAIDKLFEKIIEVNLEFF